LPTRLTHDNIVADIAARLDQTFSEATSKFRETRYIRAVLWYMLSAAEAMLNGTYSDEQHGKRAFDRKAREDEKLERMAASDDPLLAAKSLRLKRAKKPEDVVEDPFPPASVVGIDADYVYAWTEEVKAIQRVFEGLRRRLTRAGDEGNNLNAQVLRALTVDGSPGGAPKTDPKGPGGTAEQGAAAAVTGGQPPLDALRSQSRNLMSEIEGLPVADVSGIHLRGALNERHRLASGARAVDVATVLLISIQEAKAETLREEPPAS
jgi:hypothetical protein